MDSLINRNTPKVMHIDLNSCFATVEQQAHSHLRGKPLVIAAYTSPNGCVVAPSIEAKTFGIKTGMTVRDARLLCPDVIVRDPDPVMIRDVHIKFRNITRDYSPNVVPKSIDEVVINFDGVLAIQRGLENIGYEIKKRFRKEIGEWISCNVGIGTNRFLAKLAASLHKPDGLDVLNHENLLDTYTSLKLTDLNGINTRFEARLNANGIFTPLQFFQATETALKKNVFKSIIGSQWYLRLRGFEVDDVQFSRKSYGQDFALGKFTSDVEVLSQYIMKLCEKMGRRLRRAGFVARGIHIGMIYDDWTYWHRGRKVTQPMFTTQDLFTKAMWVFNQQPVRKIVSKLSVSCYDLESSKESQQSLFDEYDKRKEIAQAIDKVNDKYGEFVITPALMMGMGDVILERIAFGAVKELEDIYC